MSVKKMMKSNWNYFSKRDCVQSITIHKILKKLNIASVKKVWSQVEKSWSEI